MKPDPQKHHRNSLRFPAYDYSLPGAYFITIVTTDRASLFGEIKEGKMHLYDAGNVVWDVWKSLPDRYPQVSTDCAIVLPNHFHGIVRINDLPAVGAIHELPLRDGTAGIVGAIHQAMPFPDQRESRDRMMRGDR